MTGQPPGTSSRAVLRPANHRRAGMPRHHGHEPEAGGVFPPGTDFVYRQAGPTMLSRLVAMWRRRRRLSLVAAGDICVDKYAAHSRTFPGGQAFNFAVHASRLGARTRLAGCVGTDFWGDWLLDRAAVAGIDAALCERRAGQSFITTVDHSAAGERRFIVEDEGATGGWGVSDTVLLAAREDADLLFLTPWARAGIRLSLARTMGRPFIAFDCMSLDNAASLPAELPFVDFAFVPLGTAHDELTLVRRVISAGPPIVVVTRGERGSAVYSRGELVSERAPDATTVVDTLGAGDGFAAAFCMTYLETGDISLAHAAATARAGRVCAHMGGTQGPRGEWDAPARRSRAARDGAG